MNKLFSKTSGIVTVCLLVLLAGVGTYAYYASTITGTVTANLLAWSFKVNDETNTFTVSLPNAYPGATGSIPITLSAAGSGVDVSYTIDASMTTNPNAELLFYSDSGRSKALKLGNGCLTGTITAGQTKDATIYYSWPYGTTANNSMAGKTTTFTFTVTGKQVNA